MKNISKIIAILTLFFTHNPFQSQTFTPELKKEIRAPDKWEILYKIIADDKGIQSEIMEAYRVDDYTKLLQVNKWFERCEEVWRSKAEVLELPPSAAFIPLMLHGRFEHEKCDCDKSALSLKSLQSLNNQELLPGLKVLFIDSQIEDEFEFFLQELSIVIRLIENFDLKNPSTILKYHLVKKGETLYRLSVIYGVPVSDIQSANNLGTSTHITFGSLITIPE
ncbi:MAG: LysM peptidoglycan-binding domain-containing protein [Flavobacteriales bacterium]|nr:LysM peptidoglycan-binding domain-containing protein [Flavobacteriales bacterium]